MNRNQTKAANPLSQDVLSMNRSTNQPTYHTTNLPIYVMGWMMDDTWCLYVYTGWMRVLPQYCFFIANLYYYSTPSNNNIIITVDDTVTERCHARQTLQEAMLSETGSASLHDHWVRG